MVLGALFSLALLPAAWGGDTEDFKVGLQPDGRIVVPTNQVLRPAGKQVAFRGRPVDLALADDGRTLIVKNMSDLVFIDVATATVRQTLVLSAPEDLPHAFNPNIVLKVPLTLSGKPPPGGPPGFGVVGLLVEGDRVFAGDSQKHVRVARRSPSGRYEWDHGVELLPPRVGGFAYPAGLARTSADEFWVASSRGNSVQIVNRRDRVVEQRVAVGVAPYAICFARPDRCYVSNWGGDPPENGEPQAPSSDTPVSVDPRSGIASRGSVSVLAPEPGRWRQVKTIRVGLHPCGMALSPGRRFVYVANANSDSVSAIDTRTDEVAETIVCRPEAALPFGSGPNALAVSPDGATLFVANATNNCVAVVTLGKKAREIDARSDAPETSRVRGLIPVGWYPGAVLLSPDGKRLFVANVKGVGSLSQPRPVAEGKNTHDFLGSVSIVDIPDETKLASYTEEVGRNNRLAYSVAGLEKPRPGVAPVPVPARHGEPSVLGHVVYVIKENRSYDQILGDMKEGDGDPRLVVFGEETTPNQHALARQFTLFDNFYCSGALSATGHQWVNEAYCADYLEKAFGGFTRSYPNDGDAPLAFASSGFLWDNALRHGKTFRNFGEFTRTRLIPSGATWSDLYADFKNRTREVKVDVRANVAPLQAHTHPGYPGFPLTVPDVYRAQVFLDELKAWEDKGQMPNLVYVFLPADHTTGTRPGNPTPRAMVADNDLALGRVVEGLTRSKFWPRLVVFVVEDDPQFGLDHVDGHRTVAQVISPYTRRKFVDHTNCNQTGMVKTIELVLGLPPMNQLDLSATPMRRCFQDRPDLTPFKAVPNRIPLDEMNPPLEALRGQALRRAKQSVAMDFDKEDEADEDTLNRILWHSVHGDDKPYPERK